MIVATDSTVLIGLAKIGKLDLLRVAKNLLERLTWVIRILLKNALSEPFKPS